MKEIHSILSFYNQNQRPDLKAAMALVVRVEESSYRREGARMLVFQSGIFEGGISGGCLEGDALKRSQIAILKDKPSVITYDTSTDDENQIGVGLGCNGVIDVLISPISEEDANLDLLKRVAGSRQSHILVTVTEVSGQSSVSLGQTWYFDIANNLVENCSDTGLADTITQEAQNIIKKQKSRTVEITHEGADLAIFFEYIPAQIHLAVFGDNYDVYPMLHQARLLGWESSLVGKIQKLQRQKLGKGTDLYLKTQPARPTIDDRTAVILMAHDYKTDMANLQMAIASEAPYIGSLGPRKRFQKMLDELADRGITFTKEQLDRVYAPCGLEIGANSPEEIATSIVAEILGVMAGKPGGFLREKEGPIHERMY